MHTKDMLAAELEKIGLKDMAAKARDGYYHDFLSPLDFPEITLVDHLRAKGTTEARALAQRVINGEFDATLKESDEWANSEDGKAAFRSLMARRHK